MNSTDEAIAKAEAVLTRVSQRDVRRRVQRAGRRAVRATKFSVFGVIGVLLSAIIIGFFVPLGISGVMLTVLAMMAAVALAVMFSGEADVIVEALPNAPIKALPHQTAQWLDQQRPMLPAPAQRLSDGIGLKLEALGTQLQTLNENEPAAAEIRRLIADELPELVRGYGRVPEALRRADTNGIIPEKQLVDGLSVVDSELTRMSEQLAKGDLEKLATQGKYLELKYQGDSLS
jgi:hypothetical protein